jgi:FixJ family two-component response regulator
VTGQRTVFIVDDDEAVRDSLSWLMQSVGLRPKSFGSALEFLERYERENPGCLVLDIRMPGLSGLDLQTRLTETGIQLPVIFISGHGDVPMAVRALKAGAFDFIEKPFNDQVLLDCVQRALAHDAETRRDMEARRDVSARLELLTPREREVLDLVVDGASNKVISHTLGVSLKTVEAHRARVMEKLQAGSLSELVRLVLSVDKS